MTDIPSLVESVLRLDKEATKGPWREGKSNVWQDEILLPVCEMRHRHFYDFGELKSVVAGDSVEKEQADSALIAEYRTAAPILATEVTRLRAELETAQHDAAKEKARADFCHDALGNKCQEIDRMESRATKAEAELETERRKVEVAMDALRANQVFHTPIALSRKLDRQWDEYEADAINRTKAALTPSEKGEE